MLRRELGCTCASLNCVCCNTFIRCVTDISDLFSVRYTPSCWQDTTSCVIADSLFATCVYVWNSLTLRPVTVHTRYRSLPELQQLSHAVCDSCATAHVYHQRHMTVALFSAGLILHSAPPCGACQYGAANDGQLPSRTSNSSSCCRHPLLALHTTSVCT